MASTNVVRIYEVSMDIDSGWTLCFQWVRYNYDNNLPSQMGYRFIYRRPNGSLQAARGQARIPSAADMLNLMHLATKAGWFVACEAGRTDQSSPIVDEDE